MVPRMTGQTDMNVDDWLAVLPVAAAIVEPDGNTILAVNALLCQAVPDLSPVSAHHLAWSDIVQPLESELATATQSPCQYAARLKPNGQAVTVYQNRMSPTAMLCLIIPEGQAGDLTRLHEDFISTVSHEFRTPLTSIKGFADTLLRYGQQLAPDQQSRFLTIIKDQADRLIRLVENVLAISRHESGSEQSSFRPVALKPILDRIIQSASMQKSETQPRITSTIAPSVPDIWADADKLEQVLLNLVDNAVKYSQPAPVVDIQADLEPSDPHRVRISVADNGVGIDAAHLPTIFNRFARIDNPLTREVDGTGLGLYITRTLTLAMDGQIAVTSTPGKGTTFTVTFPVATPEHQAAYRKRQNHLPVQPQSSAQTNPGGEP
jgi:two-component system phosphate regulon sensor histidine kinase PhoR